MNFRETSGGIDTAAPPIRDRVEDVVEKHCARGGRENAGARKTGTEFGFDDVRTSCRQQLVDSGHDMVVLLWFGK